MCFFLGILLVLVGYPVLGMIIEVYGIIALFAYARSTMQLSSS